MFLALKARRAVWVVSVSAALSVGCFRYTTLPPYEVATQSDPQAAFSTVLEVVADKKYTLVTKDDAAKKLRLVSHTSDSSFIDIEVAASGVKLTPAGDLVKGTKVHRSLNNELERLDGALKDRFNGGSAPGASAASAASSTPAPASTPVSPSGVPVAWSEPAYDPSVWGNGSFTCLPVRVPADHQSALTLQLSNGEKADLQLSLAYDAGLCRSPAQCKQAGGCPALGIGDSERVTRLAGRLSRGEVSSQAILLDSGKPVANVDLAHHGSIQQAMTEIKH
jgi:hypothetical protein